MSSSNKTKIFHDKHLILQEDEKFILISDDLLKKVKEDSFDHEITNFYILELTNNPEYEENVKNRIIIINENMFTKFKKNYSDNSYELNEEILKIFTRKEILKKDFVIIIRRNHVDNYWEIIILRFPLALFNQSFFSNLLKDNDENFSKFYEKQQFSVFLIRSAIKFDDHSKQEYYKNISIEVKKSFVNDLFFLNFESEIIMNYLKDPTKFFLSEFNFLPFDLSLKVNINDSGPSILSCLHEIFELVENNDNEIQNIDFHKTISQEHCFNMRDILYIRMKGYKKDKIRTKYIKSISDFDLKLAINSQDPGHDSKIQLFSNSNREIAGISSSSINEDNEISMKVDSKHSKKIMKNLLSEILERKTANVTSLRKKSVEELKIAEDGNSKTLDENKQTNLQTNDENLKSNKNLNIAVEINTQTSNTENRFKRKKRSENEIDSGKSQEFPTYNASNKAVASLEENDLSKLELQEKAIIENNDSKKSFDAISEINSVKSQIETTTLFRRKFCELKIDNISSNVNFEAHIKKQEYPNINGKEKGCCNTCSIV